VGDVGQHRRCVYGSALCIATPYVLAMIALHHLAPADRKLWTHAALVFGVPYAGFVTTVAPAAALRDDGRQ
jgi:hypothetical protein